MIHPVPVFAGSVNGPVNDAAYGDMQIAPLE